MIIIKIFYLYTLIMLNNILKLYTKIIKNKKFTYFYALFALFFISFIVSNPENNFTQVIAFLFSFPFVKMLAVLKILVIAYHNPPLGLLNVIIVAMILSIDIVNKEDFDNIPNMVEKSKIMKYNKNFKEPKKLTTKKVEKIDETDEDKSEKEVKVRKKKKGYVVSRDLYNEKIDNKEKQENGESKDVQEVDLDEEDDTIEKELKRKHTHEIKKLNEYDDSSSSDSSESNSSDSSSDSSDSEKEIEGVSMDRARDHMLSNLRNGLKKRYLNKS